MKFHWLAKIATSFTILFVSLGTGHAQAPDLFSRQDINLQRLNGLQAREFFPLLQEELQLPLTVALRENRLDDEITLSKGNHTCEQICDEVASNLGMGWGLFEGNLIFFQVNTSRPTAAENITSYAHLTRMYSFTRFWASLSVDYRRRLVQGQLISVQNLSKEAQNVLGHLAAKDGVSLVLPKKGILAISTGNSYNIAVREGVAGGNIADDRQFRYYIPSFSPTVNVTQITGAPNIYIEASDESIEQGADITNTPPVDLAFRKSETSSLKLDATVKVELEPYAWHAMDHVAQKLSEKSSRAIRVDPQFSDSLLFTSVEKWDLKTLFDIAVVSNNASFESIADALFIKPYVVPIDDLETEIWISHLLKQSKNDTLDSPFSADEWMNGKLLVEGRTSDKQKTFVADLVEGTTGKFKKDILSHPGASARLSLGPTLRLSYYAQPSTGVNSIGDKSKNTSVLKLANHMNFPLYWDWEDS